MAVAKPDGGPRPIAMGMTLRRIAAKCVMLDLNNFCAQEFRPHQLGVGTPKGTESVVHTLRSNESQALLKIDYWCGLLRSSI